MFYALQHAFSTNITTSDVSYAGVVGYALLFMMMTAHVSPAAQLMHSPSLCITRCCNSGPTGNGVYPVQGNSNVNSSGLPYIQLLTCVNQEPTFDSSLPSGAMLFNEIACPPGELIWHYSMMVHARLLYPHSLMYHSYQAGM